MTRIVGIDTGGTYTDLVAYDPNEGSLTYSKTPTEQSDLAGGAIACLTQAAISPDNLDILKHGTTQVINAFIGRGGAPTALLTTVGFRDLLEITRGNRPIAFQLQFEKETPLVPADLRFEVGERMDGTGAILQPLDLAGLEPIARELKKRKIQALAISFLNAYLNPHHEELAATWFRENMPGLFVSIGTELSREWFEYERTSTTVANAYVGPGMKRYLDSLTSGLRERGYGANIHMMASNGGVLTPAQAQAQPVALVESGPVGGCIGAGAFAEAMNLPRIVAFDMGGTTAKCALIEDGAFEVLPTYYIGGYARGYPVRSAVLDIAEVGAGGGSIVSVSTQGRLRVGPQSAGADPGPVGFGRGGTQPTVSDADLVLGRINSGAFLEGRISLDPNLARAAIRDKVALPLGYSDSGEDIAKVAQGIIDIAAIAMSTAISEVTIERGRDLRDFALFAFGGGGPLHASKLARELHIPLVIIPTRPGNFSALGMLLAGARIDQTRTFLNDPDEAAIRLSSEIFGEMEEVSAETLASEFGALHIIHQRFADLRYKGQKHPLRLAFEPSQDGESLIRAFHKEYEQRFGHADPLGEVEMVSLGITAYSAGAQPDMEHLGLTVRGEAPPAPAERDVYFAELGGYHPTQVLVRDSLAPGFSGTGPAIIEEYGSTTIIGPDDTFEIGAMGEIRIDCTAGAGQG